MAGKKKKKSLKKTILIALAPILTVLLIVILVCSVLIGIGMLMVKAYNSVVRMWAEMGEDEQTKELIARVLDNNEPIEDLSARELSFVFSELAAITNNSDVNETKEMINIGPFSKEDFIKILDEVAKYEDDAYLYNFWYETNYLRTLTDNEMMEAYTEAYEDLKWNINSYYLTSTAEYKTNFEAKFNELKDIHALYDDWSKDTDEIHEDNFNTIILLTEWWQENAEYLHYDPIAQYIINHDWAEDENGDSLYSPSAYDRFMGTGDLLKTEHYYHLEFLIYSSGRPSAPLGTAGTKIFVPQPDPQGDNYVYTYAYPMRSSQRKTDMGYYKDLYYTYGVTWQYIYSACALHSIMKGYIYTDSASGTELTTETETAVPGKDPPKSTFTEVQAAASLPDITSEASENPNASLSPMSGLKLRLDEEFLADITSRLCGMQSLTTRTEHNLGNGIADVRHRIETDDDLGPDWLYEGYKKRKDNPLPFSRTTSYTHTGESEVVYTGEGYATIRDITPAYAIDTFTSLLVNITTETDDNHEKTVSETIRYHGAGSIKEIISEVCEEYGHPFPETLYDMCLKDLPGGSYLMNKLETESKTLNLSKDNPSYEDIFTGKKKEFKEVIYAVDFDVAEYGDMMYGTTRPVFDLNVVTPSNGQYIPQMKDIYFFKSGSGNASGQTAYCEKKDLKQMQYYLHKMEGVTKAEAVSMESLYRDMVSAMGNDIYREQIPCNNRVASTCVPYYTDYLGQTHPAYMRALSDSEIETIMARTGLRQSKLVDTVHMYDIILTALHSVGKIQYASETQQKNSGLYPSYYWWDFVDEEHDFRYWINNISGSAYLSWKNDPSGMFAQFMDLGYYGTLTYPVANYMKYKLDKYVWSKDDIAYDPLRIDIENYAENKDYLPIYDASDMGFILWLYDIAGRDALEYSCSTGYTSNVMDLFEKSGTEDSIIKNITRMGVTKYSATGDRNPNASDWCVGDIIIAVKNVEESDGINRKISTKNGEKNYHAFLYIGPTNAACTEMAVVECVGDPTWSQEYGGDTAATELQGGVAYSVIDLRADCMQGTEFYRYQVTLNGQGDYTGLPKDEQDTGALSGIAKQLEAAEHVVAKFAGVVVDKTAELLEEAYKEAIKEYYEKGKITQ